MVAQTALRRGGVFGRAARRGFLALVLGGLAAPLPVHAGGGVLDAAHPLARALTIVDIRTVQPLIGTQTARRYAQGLLEQSGFTTIYSISEGMVGSAFGPGWLARGLPVEPCEEC